MHMFKNVSFEDSVCSLCNKPHKSLECPSIIELEVTNTSQTEGNTRNYDTKYDKYNEPYHRVCSPKCQNDERQDRFSRLSHSGSRSLHRFNNRYRNKGRDQNRERNDSQCSNNLIGTHKFNNCIISFLV